MDNIKEEYMGQGKKVCLLFALLLLTSCGNIWDMLLGKNNPEAATTPASEATAVYAIPLGGVAPTRDELIIYDAAGNQVDFSGHELSFTTNNDNVTLELRPGFSTYADGSGAKIIPNKVGSTVINYSVDGVTSADKYLAIIPPQSLVQILIGEARGQMANEAQIKNGYVAFNSVSITGNAIASVVRNRKWLIEGGEPFETFIVDPNQWDLDPPSSYWDSVVNANDGLVYQFSPVDPNNAGHEVYLDSVKRIGLIDENELIAYDQAVITAAGVFNNDIADPTGGAFSFRTPTLEESQCLQNALNNKMIILPEECGPGDDNYPAFKPIQILIHPSVETLSDGRPSFVFIRARNTYYDPVVTNEP